MIIKKMYWATYSVLACLIVTQVKCGFIHPVKGFVIRKLRNITCISNPVNDVCPVNHKVPDSIPNLSRIDSESIKKVLNRNARFIRFSGGSKNCTRANEMFYCSKIVYFCETNQSYVYLDSDRVHRQCVIARRKCDGIGILNLDTFFNCDKHVNATVRYDKSEICKEYPDVENDACTKRNHKVPEFANFTSFVEEQRTIRRMIKENNVTMNCSYHVLKAACFIGSPACTKDETHAVSLLGKKLCLKVMKCLEYANNTKLTNFATNLCQKLPDEDTAKIIPIKDVEISMVTTSTSSPLLTSVVSRTSITGPISKPSKTHTTMRFPITEENNKNSTIVENNKTTTKAPYCGASNLHAMSLTFIVWLILTSFAI